MHSVMTQKVRHFGITKCYNGWGQLWRVWVIEGGAWATNAAVDKIEDILGMRVNKSEATNGVFGPAVESAKFCNMSHVTSRKIVTTALIEQTGVQSILKHFNGFFF